MKRILLAAALLPSALSAQTAPDTIRLREIVVTATRFAVPVAEAPGTVTVVDAAAMQNAGARTVADALRLVPGVSVAHGGGPGGVTSVFIRGGESDYVQVLIDGVQVNDVGGAFNWAHLRAEDVERIEVVRGPASVLYGSDAVAGVVQIFTRAGGEPRVRAALSTARGDRPRDAAGALSTHTVDAGVTGSGRIAGADASYGFDAGHTASTGIYELNSDYANTTLAGKLRLERGAADATITGRRIDHRYNFPTTGAGVVSDPNQFTEGGMLAFGLDAGLRASSRLELRLAAALHDSEQITQDPADAEGDGTSWNSADVRRRTLDARANLALPFDAMLTVGGEREWQDGQTAYESVSGWGTFADSSDHERANTAAYAQLHAAPTRMLSITAGARVESHDSFGRFTTGRIAAAVRPLPETRLHASFGTAFREPTFFENYATGFTRGNPELDPERTRSAELGVQHEVAGVSAGITAFRQRFTNLIQYTGSPAAGQPNYLNVGAARAQGVEAGLNSLPRAAVQWSLSWTLTDTEVEDAGVGSDRAFQQGTPLLRRPHHSGAATLAVPVHARLRTFADLRYTGAREDLDFTTDWQGARVTLDAYALLGIGAETDAFTLAGRPVTASLRVDNINVTGDGWIDGEYQPIYNFPGAGPTLTLGLRY